MPRQPRSREDKARAIARVERDGPQELTKIAGTKVRVGGQLLSLTYDRLKRWILEGRRGVGGHVYMDGILRDRTWFSSEAAVTRFLHQLAERQAG